ncbi:Embryogenesis-associated protein EMB8 [Zancudomyces culisetae]|uniref:Embryogenesis-associated protein EMB8 n=1 Tax=Zancudomyces culisetae TaxID=1213189 RepID=A0A1R1PDF3_ZANCU|nr:Embryogenesis-associated protein EMB8 [Zancudomyces culisetae]|eukprot:OMH79014.1 Embryogenesis-associated protein EMB8 [Zancudomyces culisetae]
MASTVDNTTNESWVWTALSYANPLEYIPFLNKEKCEVMLEYSETGAPKTFSNESRLIDVIKSSCPSLYVKNQGPAVFHPSPMLPTGDFQTLYCGYMNVKVTPESNVKYERELIIAEDGGTISLDWAVSKNDLKPNTPVCVLLPGLQGGSHEFYIRTVVKKLTSGTNPYRVVIVNHRGCARTPLTSPRLYSAGHTADFKMVVNKLVERYPEAKFVCAGFSLGSNLIVKYIGEEGEKVPFVAAVSVCNPFDLRVSGAALNRPRFFNKYIYLPRLTGSLQKFYARFKDVISAGDCEFDDEKIIKSKTFEEIDNNVTAKAFGYKDCYEYYDKSSCNPYLEKVSIPLLCINTADDPITPPMSINFSSFKENPNLVLALVPYGGHIGFFESFSGTTWHQKPISEFFEAVLNQH